jgi:Bacterial archaeo-eukaryotic release factor family 10
MVELTSRELFDPEALLALSRRTAAYGVLSIYVQADARADPGLQGAAIDIKNRLAELRRNVAAEGPPGRTQAIRDGIERLTPEIERLTNPKEPGRGRALFAPLDGELIRFSSQMPIANRVVLDAGPFIHPLLELLDEGRPAGVILVSADEARLLEWRLGELRELERLEPDIIEAPHERSGPVGSSPTERAGSPKRDQRQARDRDQALRFVDRVEAAASRLVGEHGWERVLVSGGDRLTEPLAARLTRTLGDEVIRDQRVLTRHDEYESQLVRDARQAALGAGTGALGLSEVVGALNEGRVSHLIYDPHIRYEGSIGADGRLLAGDEAGPDDADGVAEPRLTERLVERALETGARVTPVEGAARAALAEAAGIAALLRW